MRVRLDTAWTGRAHRDPAHWSLARLHDLRVHYGLYGGGDSLVDWLTSVGGVDTLSISTN